MVTAAGQDRTMAELMGGLRAACRVAHADQGPFGLATSEVLGAAGLLVEQAQPPGLDEV